MIWKDKDCEKCIFRVDMDCRRFPPSSTWGYWDSKPKVRKATPSGNFNYADACAEYKENP